MSCHYPPPSPSAFLDVAIPSLASAIQSSPSPSVTRPLPRRRHRHLRVDGISREGGRARFACPPRLRTRHRGRVHKDGMGRERTGEMASWVWTSPAVLHEDGGADERVQRLNVKNPTSTRVRQQQAIWTTMTGGTHRVRREESAHPSIRRNANFKSSSRWRAVVFAERADGTDATNHRRREEGKAGGRR
ncbi:hypothetical protein SCHPADRAFT_948424 [Schizopora paradoxa]|uniref:Uncharacterized protein n=1 Tax=Schizopora paradoxa TaxID=27342 RepID=A0A0H2QVV8_9AGAM|nr:hypothetical protein SCHPADRAFT_948424 [Schizopora paradoxa]